MRASNGLGHSVYTKMGYVIYRRVLNYYSGKDDDEDALGKSSVASIEPVVSLSQNNFKKLRRAAASINDEG